MCPVFFVMYFAMNSENGRSPIKQIPVESFLSWLCRPFSFAIFLTVLFKILPKGNNDFESWARVSLYKK